MSGHVLTFGESMGVVVLPGPSAPGNADAVRTSFGGAESNVAVGLVRLGVRAVWASRLGNDLFGSLIRERLQHEGVEVVAAADPARSTGFMLKNPDGVSGARVNYYRRGSAASQMGPDDLPVGLIDSAALIHFSGIVLALSPTTRVLVRFVLRRAKELAIPVSFDLNHRPALWSAEEATAAYLKVLPACQLVFAGDDEAALVSKHGSSEQRARTIQALGPRTVVIKHGADGAEAFSEGGSLHQPPFRTAVVDTVGAGDAFAAGYLAAMLDGADAASRLRAGAATGALVCRSTGDWEAAATPDEVVALTGVEPAMK